MAYLQIKAGEGDSRRVDLPDSGEIVLGRLASSNVQLDYPSVSGRHCSLSKDGARYRLKDLDSTNGTCVNGESVAESIVHRGDVISLGDLQVVLMGEDVPEPPRSVVIPEHIAAKVAVPPVAGLAPAATSARSSAPASKAATGPQFQPLTPASASSAKLPKAFKKKRSHNRIWAVVILFACALAVFLAVMLFQQMAG